MSRGKKKGRKEVKRRKKKENIAPERALIARDFEDERRPTRAVRPRK